MNNYLKWFKSNAKGLTPKHERILLESDRLFTAEMKDAILHWDYWDLLGGQEVAADLGNV